MVFVRYHFSLPSNICSTQLFARLQILTLALKDGWRMFLLDSKFESILLLGRGRFCPFHSNTYYCLLCYIDRKQQIKTAGFEYGIL